MSEYTFYSAVYKKVQTLLELDYQRSCLSSNYCNIANLSNRVSKIVVLEELYVLTVSLV